MPITISHPQKPPSWLPEWPTQAQVQEQYTLIIRNMAANLIASESKVRLFWNDTTLSATIGVHNNIWKLKEGIWDRTCSCKAPQHLCPHNYATCLLLFRVCYDQGWITPPSQRRQPKPQQTQTRRPVQQNIPFNINQDTSPGTVQKIEAEIDAKYSVTEIMVRFYRNVNDSRELLTIAQILNMGSQILLNNPHSPFSKEDREFVAWTTKSIRSSIPSQAIPYNSKFLTISKQTFHAWQLHWEERQPNRFIDRATQKPLAATAETKPVDLVLKLTYKKPFFFAEPNYVFQDGKHLTLLQVATLLENASEFDRLAFKAFKPLFKLDPFWRGPLKLSPQQMETRLSSLVDNKLELVTGSAVRQLAQDKINVHLGTRHGNFTITAKLKEQLIELDGNAPINPAIEVKDEFVEISQAGGKNVEFIRQAVRDIQPRVYEHGSALLYDTHKNAQLVKDFWNQLPEDFNRTCDLSLQELLCPTPDNQLKLNLHASKNNAFAMLKFSWTTESQKARLSLEDLNRIARTNSSVYRTSDGNWIDIDPEQARLAIERLKQAGLNLEEETEVLARHAAETIEKITSSVNPVMDDASREVAKKLLDQPPLELPPIPQHLDSILRSYQREGVNFLLDTTVCGVGPILADDMGLGKTLQVLAMLDALDTSANQEGRSFRALVVAPASVVPVWTQQAKQFCPSLPIQAIKGTPAQRKSILENYTDGILTINYQLARMDIDDISQLDLDCLVLDETQTIKNPKAQVTAAINDINAKHVVALTGTPLENSLQDLWSIMNRLNPSLFGSLDDFNERYVNARGGIAALSKKLSFFLKRRTKAEVAKELPPKTVEILSLELPQEQRDFYDAQLAIAKQDIHAANKSNMEILSIITRLRQACCHPDLVAKRETSLPSAKLDLLLEKLEDLQATGHSALVFSQFTSMLDIIANALQGNNMPFYTITGETPTDKRADIVQAFDEDPNPATFLLSLKAAGTGLTLTKADYVFLFDPWWNPAVENQAIDRAHRIGQDKPVIAYKFIAATTIEEKVQQLINDKQALFDQVMDGATESALPGRLTANDLKALLED
jgi:SNF2 family DNA or RNA helicase